MKKYLITFFLLTALTSLSAEVLKVTANGHDKEHKAENTIDDSMKTRWANKGDSWLIYEFKNPTELNSIDIATFKGDERKQKFKVFLSLDGKKWNEIFEAESTGTTADYERYTFKSTEAKFVKIETFGTDVSKSWSGINEINFNSDAQVKIIIKK